MRVFNRGVNVFTYGSLLFDGVWEAVVGRIGPSFEGRLDGFEAWKITGQVFPGLAPACGHQVAGRVWQGVTAVELAKLDAFESGIYDRERVPVQTSSGKLLKCWAYVVRPDCRDRLRNERWDRDEFQRLHLEDFVK